MRFLNVVCGPFLAVVVRAPVVEIREQRQCAAVGRKLAARL